MKLFITFFIISLISGITIGQIENYEDNDFAEFDDFEDDFNQQKENIKSNGAPSNEFKSVDDIELKNVKDSKQQNKQSAQQQQQQQQQQQRKDDFGDDDDGLVEDEFEHFQDEEEFEGFDGGDSKEIPLNEKIGPNSEPKLTITNIHFRTHWDSYWMEMLMIAGLTTYFANFFFGKSKNSKLANLWLSTHRQLLEENFVLVGDDGKMENENPGLIKESESLYTLWCSGRTCCEGMLVELKMIKRQDLVALISSLMRPNLDTIKLSIELSSNAIDTFVFCVATKKTATRLFKDTADLSKFCSLVSKPEDKYKVPIGFSVLSEIPEATATILDSRLLTALQKYSNLIEYIHISDQYCGQTVLPDESANILKQPDVKRILNFSYNLPKNCDMETVKPLLILVFYIMERLKRYRLSKEGKMKADKNRLRVEEEFLKSTHAARAEAAAQRREDKRKQEKEKIMAEDDPEKQRRWEMKEQKRQAKKKAPKMKRLAVKAL